MSGTTAVRNIRETEGVPNLNVWLENFRAVCDSMETCMFLHRELFMDPEDLIPLIRAVTGREFTEQEFLRLGERIYNIERLFNLREGLKPSEDNLPKRYISEPIVDGVAEGSVNRLDEMLGEYYTIREWDQITGYPSDRKLEELGLQLKE
jgi:aldehyde:ferredoxin oxidoreductase